MSLPKPSWAANQGALLAIMWTVIHLLNAVAVWFVYLDAGFQRGKWTLAVYFATQQTWV